MLLTKRDDSRLHAVLLSLIFFGGGLGGLKAAPGPAPGFTKEMSALPPLIVAARQGDFKRVRSLLAHGAAINGRGKNGQTPLMEIAQHGNLKMMALLVAKGADVNLQDKDGETALKLVLSGPAAESDAPVPPAVELQEVRFLLQHGALINVKDKDGDTALIMAMIEEPSALAAMLVAHGADVNTHGSQGQTPLMMAATFFEGRAAYGGHGADNLQLLLSHGVKVNAKDGHGATALFYGVTDQYGTTAVWDVYYSDTKGKKSLQDILKEMTGQSEAEEIETAHLLLNHGADVNVRDQDGKTVLDYAKSENHPHLVAELEKAGGTE